MSIAQNETLQIMKRLVSPDVGEVGSRPKKHFSKYRPPLMEMPNLVESQIDSYKWLLSKGLEEVRAEFSAISDYSGKKFELNILNFKVSGPKYDEHYAKAQKRLK